MTYIILSMILAGVLGGAVGYIFESETKQIGGWEVFLRYVVAGIGATTLIPLFLQIGDSQLIQNIVELSTPDDDKKTNELEDAKSLCEAILVFFSFCMLAAIYSRRFINSIAERVLRRVEKNNEAIKKETDEKLRQAETQFKQVNEEIHQENQIIKATIQATMLKPEDIEKVNAKHIPSTASLSAEALQILDLMQSNLHDRKFFTAAFFKRVISEDRFEATMEALEQTKFVCKVTTSNLDTWYLTIAGQQLLLEADTITA